MILESLQNIGGLCAPYHVKILLRNFGGMLIFADFAANFYKFQIFLEPSIFVVQNC